MGGRKKKSFPSKILPPNFFFFPSKILSLRSVSFKRKLLLFAAEPRTQEPNERQESNKTGHELCCVNNSHSPWGSVSEVESCTVTAK